MIYFHGPHSVAMPISVQRFEASSTASTIIFDLEDGDNISFEKLIDYRNMRRNVLTAVRTSDPKGDTPVFHCSVQEARGRKVELP